MPGTRGDTSRSRRDAGRKMPKQEQAVLPEQSKRNARAEKISKKGEETPEQNGRDT